MIAVPLNIVLHANQRLIHNHPARLKVVKAGKRFGKSKGLLFDLVKKALSRPRQIVWYVAPTYRQAKNIAWQEIEWLVPKQVIKRSVENELTKTFVNDSVLKLIGADNPDALRGIKIDHLGMDEYAYTDPYAWEGILSGQLLGSDWTATFISSPNKLGRNHFSNFYDTAKMKMDQGDKKYAAFYFTVYDNPTIPKSEIDALKENTPDDTWELEYMAKESAHAGQLVSEFSYAEHVKEMETGENWQLVRGLDWGISHPTACLWVYVDKRQQMLYIPDEFMRSNLVIQESCGIIKQMTGNRPVEWSVIDPSTAKRNSQTGRRDCDEFMRYGIGCVPGDNRDRGIDIMKMFFKKNMVRIHPKCKNLILQLKNVQYGDKEGEDLIDCLRYIIVRVHDFMFGGNLFPREQVLTGKGGRELNMNSPMFGGVRPNDFSWATGDMEEVA